MSICMSVRAGHYHDEACDARASVDGRTTTVVSIRLPDDLARKIRHLAGNYQSVNEYMVGLVRTQAARPR